MEDKTKSGSAFLKELEERLDDIFAEEKPGKVEEPAPAAAPILAEAPVAAGEESRAEAAGGDDRSGSIKELKSVVLSLEWELNDEGLARFDEEILKVEGFYSDDLIVLAFARILRFLGRYIRVKSSESEPRAINMLLSTYDNLEKVILSPEMTEREKHSLMVGNITDYRRWVEGVDLAAGENPGETAQQDISDGKPALQVLARGPQASEERPGEQIAEEALVRAPSLEASSVAESRLAGYPSDEASSEAPPVREEGLYGTQEEAGLEGEAAQWKKALERESLAAAQEDDAAQAVHQEPDYIRQERSDEVRPDGIRPDEILQVATGPDEEGGETRPVVSSTESSADDIGDISGSQPGMTSRVTPEGEGALTPDLERIRREVRDEIIQELRAEIDALREEIRFLSAKVNN